jgi:hypothetical protein
MLGIGRVDLRAITVPGSAVDRVASRVVRQDIIQPPAGPNPIVPGVAEQRVPEWAADKQVVSPAAEQDCAGPAAVE